MGPYRTSEAVFPRPGVSWCVSNADLLGGKTIECGAQGLTYFFLLGALAPLVGYILERRFQALRYINFPLVFAGTAAIPPANAVNYVTWAIVAFVTQYLVKRRKFEWWTKYNCKYRR